MAEPKMAESKFDLNELKMKTEVQEQRQQPGWNSGANSPTARSIHSTWSNGNGGRH